MSSTDTGEEKSMRKIAFALVTLLTIFWIAAATWADLGEVRVGVDGMTCVT